MSKYKHLEDKIRNSYEEGITILEAEKLAGEFLSAMLSLSEDLKVADLNARMRKSGLKAVRAAIYLDAVQKADKKPSDVLLDNTVNTNEIVQTEQDEYDKAEVEKDSLERVYNTFLNAHLHFRAIAKGKFE